LDANVPEKGRGKVGGGKQRGRQKEHREIQDKKTECGNRGTGSEMGGSFFKKKPE